MPRAESARGERDRAAQVLQTHVVEQDHVRARGQSFLDLLERIAFDLYLGQDGNAGASALSPRLRSSHTR